MLLGTINIPNDLILFFPNDIILKLLFLFFSILKRLKPDADFISLSENSFPGNPLTQDILTLYLEPDGTRRLLNYLLDNLAGTAKRSKCSWPASFSGS